MIRPSTHAATTETLGGARLLLDDLRIMFGDMLAG
jgi:hypothetical protein